MTIKNIYIMCSHCGSNDLQEISRKPVTEQRYTDHEITYRCKDCGETTTIGVFCRD